ncbi:MAG: hypothetical protein ACKOTZ_06615 [Chloroflexota bacterium]
MNRRITAIVSSLALVAFLGSSVTAAPPSQVRARAGIAEAGAKMLVKAKVIRPDRTRAFSATATVELDGGPVTVDLRRAGKRSYLALTRVDVPADEALGCKDVQVTVTYGDETVVKDVKGVVIAPESDPELAPAC